MTQKDYKQHINDNVLELALDIAKKHVKKGWMINPDTDIAKRILKRTIICQGECPCHNESEDKLCPCSDYRLNDNCHCNLYVKEQG